MAKQLSDRSMSMPIWLARFLNTIPGVRWTRDYCSGGCGRPVSGDATITIDHVDGVPVKFMLCRVGGDCEYEVMDSPRDADGTHYSEIRPGLLQVVRDNPDDKPESFTLSFTA